jgi:hypothetical protein
VAHGRPIERDARVSEVKKNECSRSSRAGQEPEAKGLVGDRALGTYRTSKLPGSGLVYKISNHGQLTVRNRAVGAHAREQPGGGGTIKRSVTQNTRAPVGEREGVLKR